MRGLLRPALLGAATAVLLSSCGGASETGAASDGTSVITASAGGLQATLSLTPESLPDGVSLSEVELEMLVDEDAESGAPAVALLLLPDGLILDEAATLTVGLPDVLLNSAFMATHVSGDSVEFLEGELVVVNGDVSFRTPINHFSLLDLSRIEGVVDVSLSVVPERVSVGQTHEATATMTVTTEPIEVFFSFSSEDGNFRKFRFSAPQVPILWESPAIAEFATERWLPAVSAVEVMRTAAGWETSAHVSECLEANFIGVNFYTVLTANVTLLSRGESEPREFIGFSRTFTGEEGPNLGDAFEPHTDDLSDATYLLLNVAEGDTVTVFMSVFDFHKALCTADPGSITEATAPSSTSVASSSTDTSGPPPPPVNKIGEASDESGDAGDPRYDITELAHEEQDGSHSLRLQLGGGLVVGDEGVTAVKMVAPGSGNVSDWEIEWAITEFGSTASVSGAQPTPRLNVFGDRLVISFSKFPDGLPSGTQVDITSCNADSTVCDSITYTVP